MTSSNRESKSGCGVAFALAMGVVLLLIVGIAVAFCFGDASTVTSGVGGLLKSAGYRFEPGIVTTDAKGRITTTLHIELDSGWAIDSFSTSAERIWTTEARHKCEVVSTLPVLPTTRGFDVVYAVPDVPAGRGEAGGESTRLLLINLDIECSAGSFFSRTHSTSGSYAFDIDTKAGRLVKR